MKKAILIFLCSALLLSGCQSTAGSVQSSGAPPSQQPSAPPSAEPNAPAARQTDSPSLPVSGDTPSGDGFQKEMSVNHPFRLSATCMGNGGYYLMNEGYLYYMEAASGRMVLLCGKPECDHSDPVSCNAWANTKFLTFYDGKLWYTNSDAFHDSRLTLCTMAPDGSDHRDVQCLMTQEDFVGWSAADFEPMLWNGEIYFILQDKRVCKNRIGGEPEDNVTLFTLDATDKLKWNWRFWADGDSAYVMCIYMDKNGYYQAALTLLGDSPTDTREIWHSALYTRVGEDVEFYLNGVDKFPFYITGGHLYYLATGAFWDVDLTTGAETKLAEVSGNQALFTDDAMYLYSAPDRTIAVYGLDGTQRGAVSLSPIYAAYDNISSCDPVFADGGMFYLLCYRGSYLSVTSSLYRIDTATGEVLELRDWPATNQEPPQQNSGEILIGAGL